MSANPEDIVQQIQQEFDALLDYARQVPSSQVAEHGISAYGAEGHLLSGVLKLGGSLLTLFFLSQAAAYRCKTVNDAQGIPVPYHSERSRSYWSVFGKVKITRSFYFRTGVCLYPADAAWNLPLTQCSDLLRQLLEKLGVMDPYQKASEILHAFLGQQISTRELKEQVDHDGDIVKEFYEQAPPPCAQSEASILVVQADGKGVPIIRKEAAEPRVRLGKGEKNGKKKEAIVTAAYTIAPCIRTPEMVVQSLFKQNVSQQNFTATSVSPASSNYPVPTITTWESSEGKHFPPQNKRYYTTLSGKEEGVRFTKEQVSQREGSHIQHMVALTDGSEPLQQQILDQLPHFTLILDFIHADEYLWKVANALLGEKDPRRKEWVLDRTRTMLCGKTEELIAEFRHMMDQEEYSHSQRETLRTVANYFERNLEYMGYDKCLAQGWPIATGVIEGACRHIVKDRCELSGMRWNKSGAEALLALRCVEENGDWEDFHNYRRAKRHREVYGVIETNTVDLPGYSAYAPPQIRLAA